MANALQDNLRVILSRAVEEAARSAGANSRTVPTPRTKKNSVARSVAAALPGRGASSNGPLSGTRGLLVGAGAAALAPVAVKGAAKLAKGAALNGLSKVAAGPVKAVEKVGSTIATAPGKAAEKVGSGVSSAVGDKLSKKLDDAGGPSGILKDAAKSALPFGGGSEDKGGANGEVAGVGKGRRMPIQQSIDIGLPLETVYNQWTQFEEWPSFMHRITEATQDDDTTVSFATKIWGKSKDFKADIETQHPDERIKWRVSEGIKHSGVVTFHELGPQLTRLMLSFDVDPGGPLEKLARGARHIKRAARGDLHRFKAFIEMQERETGAWRGVIEEGEVVQKHDPSYDKQREYFESGSGGAGKKQSRGGGRSRSRSGSQSTGRSRASGSSRSTGSSSRSRASSSGSKGSSSRSRASSSGSRASSSGSRASSSRSKGSSSGSRASSSRSKGSSSGSRASSSRSKGASSGGRGGSSGRGSAARNQGSSGSRSSSGRAQRSSGRGQGSGSTSSRASSSRNGSDSASRSRSAVGGSNSSGRSSGASGRSRSATRSRPQAARSNGKA